MTRHRHARDAGDDAPDALLREQAAWSLATFGDRPASGPLNHLRREIDEAIEAIASGDREAVLEEFADCYLLLGDALWRSGLSLTWSDVLRAARAKFERNKRRTWGPVNAEGFAEHVRDDEEREP